MTIINNQFWILKPPTDIPIFIIIDLSQSATPYFDKILDATHEIIENIPASLETSIFFLGCDTQYTTNDFLNRRNELKLLYEDQISLLFPIFNLLEKSQRQEKKILIIGNGQIFDLEDWYSEGEFYFLQIGSDSMSNNKFENYTYNNSKNVIKAILDLPERLEIHFEPNVLISWNNSSFYLQKRLLIHDCKDISKISKLSMHVFGPSINAPDAYLLKKSGIKKSLQVKEYLLNKNDDNILNIEETWIKLDNKEKLAFENIILKKNFTCPRCGNTHPPNKTTCENENDIQIFPKIIFPTLAEKNVSKGIIRFRISEKNVEVNSYLYKAYPINDKKVVIVENNKPFLYLWENESFIFKEYLDEWIFTFFDKTYGIFFD